MISPTTLQRVIAKAIEIYPRTWRGAHGLLRANGYQTATIAGEIFRCDTDHTAFWDAVSAKAWEPDTFAVFRRFLTAESVHYDIGSWIGPTVIYAARRAARVVAFEPDPTAFEYLLRNVRLNGLMNVQAYHLALAHRDGALVMSSFGGGYGDSQTSVLNPGAAGAIEALGLSWATWRSLTDAPAPTFIKMDVEGAEFGLLPTMARDLAELRPTLFLATHAPYLRESERLPALRQLREVLSVYPAVLDSAMRPLTLDDLTSERTASTFRDFVLTA